MAEVLIALEEVIDSNLEGKPHSMKSLSSKLSIPYTSVSRIVYSLTAEAQPGGVLKLVPDSKDRRRKHIELDADALKRMGSHVRALEKAMIDYYGASVYKAEERPAELASRAPPRALARLACPDYVGSDATSERQVVVVDSAVSARQGASRSGRGFRRRIRAPRAGGLAPNPRQLRKLSRRSMRHETVVARLFGVIRGLREPRGAAVHD